MENLQSLDFSSTVERFFLGFVARNPLNLLDCVFGDLKKVVPTEELFLVDFI